jgi:phosphoribosylformylglycinamidine synthase
MKKMKAKVFVALKKTVLDPQGKTILAALQDLGFRDVADVRQGKYFEISLANGLTAEQAQEQIARIARDVLTNPVIEGFSFEILDKN